MPDCLYCRDLPLRSTAWGIVEKHGGSITLDSRMGVGSEVVVSLPVVMQS